MIASEGPVAARLRGVTRRFRDVVAVDDLDLELGYGQVLGVLGPNGSGKSTTIRLLLGLLLPTAGTVELLEGRPDLAARRRVGFLPEQRGLYEDMGARDQLAWFGELFGLERGEARRRAGAWLERLGLGDRADSHLPELSKGMQQRVQLATALIHEPPVLVLDEPFSGLDPVSRDLFAEVVREQAARGASVLLCTHELAHAEQVCDRVAVLIKGRKEIDAPLGTLRREAGHGAVRLAVEGELGWLQAPEVREVVALRDGLEVRLADGVPPRWVLERALAAGVVPERFEVAAPSLHEIVVGRIKDAWVEGEEAA